MFPPEDCRTRMALAAGHVIGLRSRHVVAQAGKTVPCTTTYQKHPILKMHSCKMS